MISLLFLNNFYPVISHRRVQKKKKSTNYCIRFGHSLWSANQLPAQGVTFNYIFCIDKCLDINICYASMIFVNNGSYQSYEKLT